MRTQFRKSIKSRHISTCQSRPINLALETVFNPMKLSDAASLFCEGSNKSTVRYAST